MTEKYLARLIRAKHRDYTLDDDDDSEVVRTYLMCFFRRSRGIVDDNRFVDAIAKSETLEDLACEFAKQDCR